MLLTMLLPSPLLPQELNTTMLDGLDLPIRITAIHVKEVKLEVCPSVHTHHECRPLTSHESE